jgi:hypothetical protein
MLLSTVYSKSRLGFTKFNLLPQWKMKFADIFNVNKNMVYQNTSGLFTE